MNLVGQGNASLGGQGLGEEIKKWTMELEKNQSRNQSRNQPTNQLTSH